MATYNSQSNAGSGSLTGGLKVATPKIRKKEKEKKTDWLGLAAEIAGGAAGAGLGFAVGGPVGASIGAGVGMKGGQMGGIAANKAAGLEGKVERTPYTELASAAVGGALRSEGMYEGFDEAEAATEALDARMTQGGLAGTPTPSPTPQPAVPTSARGVPLGPGQVAGLTDEFIAGEQGRHYAEALRQEAAVDLSRQRLAADTVRVNQELANLRNDPSRRGELNEFLSTQTPKQREEFLGGVYGGGFQPVSQMLAPEPQFVPKDPGSTDLNIYPPVGPRSFPVEIAPPPSQYSVSDLANQPVTPNAGFHSPGFKEDMTTVPEGDAVSPVLEELGNSSILRGGATSDFPSFDEWRKKNEGKYATTGIAKRMYNHERYMAGRKN